MGGFCSTDDKDHFEESMLPLPRPPRCPPLLDLCLDQLCSQLALLYAPLQPSGSKPAEQAEYHTKLALMRKLRQAFLGSKSSKLPEELVERVFYRMVELRLLNVYNVKLFSTCRIARLHLPRYTLSTRGVPPLPDGTSAGEVTDEWIQSLLAAQSQPHPEVADVLMSTQQSLKSSSSSSSSSSSACVDVLPFKQLPSGAFRRNSIIDRLVVHTLTHCDLSGCVNIRDTSLHALVYCTELERLELDGCVNITDAGLSVLSNMPLLTHLNLNRCQEVSDVVLSLLKDKKELRFLSLEACVRITDSGMANLRAGGINQLHTLSVGWCNKITSDGLQFIPDCPALTDLNIAHTAVSSAGFKQVFEGKMKNFKRLNLAGMQVNDVSLRVLRSAPAVEELYLQHSRCKDLSFLAYMPNLRILDISYTGVPALQIQQHINTATTLQVLRMEACNLDDAGQCLAAVAALTALTELNVGDTRTTNTGLSKLRNLARLAILNFSCTTVTNTGLAALASLSSLTEIHLDCADINDAGLHHLQPLQQLRTLDLFSSPVSDRGLDLLLPLRSLTNLEVCSGRITNAGVAKIAALSNLTSLNIAQNSEIDDKGITALGALLHLRHLNLSRTRVTHKGLSFLRSLPCMHSLSVFGCERVDVTSPKVKILSERVHVGSSPPTRTAGASSVLNDDNSPLTVTPSPIALPVSPSALMAAGLQLKLGSPLHSGAIPPPFSAAHLSPLGPLPRVDSLSPLFDSNGAGVGGRDSSPMMAMRSSSQLSSSSPMWFERRNSLSIGSANDDAEFETQLLDDATSLRLSESKTFSPLPFVAQQSPERASSTSSASNVLPPANLSGKLPVFTHRPVARSSSSNSNCSHPLSSSSSSESALSLTLSPVSLGSFDSVRSSLSMSSSCASKLDLSGDDIASTSLRSSSPLPDAARLSPFSELSPLTLADILAVSSSSSVASSSSSSSFFSPPAASVSAGASGLAVTLRASPYPVTPKHSLGTRAPAGARSARTHYHATIHPRFAPPVLAGGSDESSTLGSRVLPPSAVAAHLLSSMTTPAATVLRDEGGNTARKADAFDVFPALETDKPTASLHITTLCAAPGEILPAGGRNNVARSAM